MVTIEVDMSQLDEFGPKMPEIRHEGLKLVALDMQRTVDKLSPVDEGLLHKWFIAEASDSQYTLRSPAKYVGFVNYGTGPYFLRPKNKKALHWAGASYSANFYTGHVSKTGGAFSKGHMMPSKPGQHFIEKAIDEVNPRIDDHFKTAISEVLG